MIYNELVAFDDLVIDIFKGNFSTITEPNSALIRIFLSSTFTG